MSVIMKTVKSAQILIISISFLHATPPPSKKGGGGNRTLPTQDQECLHLS